MTAPDLAALSDAAITRIYARCVKNYRTYKRGPLKNPIAAEYERLAVWACYDELIRRGWTV